MPIYEISEERLIKIPQTNFANEGIRERDDLQRLLRRQVEIVAPDTLVIAEEFGEWEDSRRRIDLLGVDKDANLVVIELKRTEDGGHMDLQAIRYAAMVSTLTFEKVVDIFTKYLSEIGDDSEARGVLLEFLEWDEVLDDEFAQEVKIVLASAEFSKELTTSVIWLNNCGLDIRCVRMRPYKDGAKVLLDIQQVIPLPEAEDYQVQIRNKERLERVSRNQNRDLTKFTITVGGESYERLAKRQAIFKVVKYLADKGVNPEAINESIHWKGSIFLVFDGSLSSVEFQGKYKELQESTSRRSKVTRWFINDDQLIHANNRTYALTKMWGSRTEEAIGILVERYSEYEIKCVPAD